MARPHSGKVSPQALQHIRPRHRQMMYRLIAGETQVSISKEMGITEHRLSIVVNSPLFKIEFKKLEDAVFDKMVEQRGNIDDRVAKLQPSALTVIEDMMKSKNTPKRLKRDCAKDIIEMDQKRRRINDDDGLSPFARTIAEAFDLAKTASETPNGDAAKPVIEVDSMELNSETGLPVDDPDDKEGGSVNESVEELLGEMGIMDPVELKTAS